MKIIKLNIEIKEYSRGELPTEDLELVQNAENFLTHAYAPYSKFNVSAAAKLDNGIIVNGTNQENAASPSGLCAERTAVFYANSMYPNNKITTIAITAFTGGKIIETPITPCGACRQVLLETENRYGSPIKIILSGANKCLIINSVKDILPLNFDSTFLN